MPKLVPAAAKVLAALVLVAPLGLQAQESDTHGGVYSEGGFDNLGDPSPPRAPEPIRRGDFNEMVGKLFSAADSNRDGTITLAELQAIIAARKEQAIQARFEGIDTDRNRSLSAAEFAHWQRGLGTAVLDDTAAGGLNFAEVLRVEPGRGREEQAIAALVEPLGSTMLTAANTNYDAGVTLDELVAYEGKRFDRIDANRDGFLVNAEVTGANRGG